MFTKKQAKLIKSLHDKKGRNETGLFLVEGEKNVVELLNSNFETQYVLCTESFFDANVGLIKSNGAECDIVRQEEIEKVGTLESNDSALAVVKQNESSPLLFLSPSVIPAKAGIHPPVIASETKQSSEIILALDNIQDPGNLGTIIRIADWYGIKKIIASENSVDFYNPKVISATKGSFLRIDVSYANLAETLPKIGLPIFGAFMSGESIHSFPFPKSGILLMGNESNGISKELEKIITPKITIPSFGSAESLNVAIATSIILDNWKRNF